MIKHTISIEDYINYKNEVILASSSRDQKTLYAIFTIDDRNASFKIEYEKGTQEIEDFEQAIEIYNNI